MSKPRTVRMSVRTVQQMTICDLEGDIDIRNASELRARLLETLEMAARLSINLGGIRYVDSAGIATLVEVRLKAQQMEKDFTLFGVSERIFALIKLTRLVGFFRVAGSEEEAVEGRVQSDD